MFITSFAIGSFSFSIALTSLSDAFSDASALSIFASQSLAASAASPVHLASFKRIAMPSLIFSIADAIPNPYSALSSNSEFAQAGPLPEL